MSSTLKLPATLLYNQLPATSDRNNHPLTALDIVGSASVSANLSMRGASTAHTLNILDNGTLNIQRSPGGDGGLTTALFMQNNGNIGIGTTAPAYTLDVRGTASISSTLSLGPLTQGSAGTCVNNAGKMYYDGTANSFYFCNRSSWSVMGSGSGGGGVWQELTGAIVPNNSTLDVLFGGQATSSAKFKFLNIASGTPTASISGSVANVAMVLDGNGNITTTNMQPLVIGNASTGSIQLKPKGTTGLYVDGTGVVGINTTTPRVKLDVLSTTGAQLRLTYTDNSVYTGLTTDSSGNLTVSATGTKVIVSPYLQVSG